jgi:DNA-binding MurR/RpiR family transcriptional regulator
VRTLTSRDLLIAISFGQCLARHRRSRTAREKTGCSHFRITDSETSPLAKICEDTCFASVASPSFVGSYVAPFSLLGTILTACAHTQTARALELLRRSEEEDRADRRWYNAERDINEVRK